MEAPAGALLCPLVCPALYSAVPSNLLGSQILGADL